MIKALALRGGDDAARGDLAEKICRELERRRFSTALWKQEREEELPDSGGPAAVIIKGSPSKRQITWQKPLDLIEMLPYIHADYIIFDHYVHGLPHLLLSPGDPDRFALASTGGEDFSGLGRPVFTADSDFSGLMDFIVGSTPPLLPFPDGNPCCKGCGHDDCIQFLPSLLNGEKSLKDCVLQSADLEIKVNGQSMQLVKFVRDIARDINLAFLGTLDGFERNSVVEIIIDDRK